MGKETVICIIIVILIVIGNIVTQNYTIDSVRELTNKLTEVKSEFSKNESDISKDNIKEKIKDVEDSWNSRHDKLAYFIEHDELEKVETYLAGYKSYVETHDKDMALSDLDKTEFILEHISNKYKFTIENII